jgi:hypothetical protein
MKKLNILILNTIGLIGFLVFTFGASSSWAQSGVDQPGVFELDGNTPDIPAGGALDWEGVFPPAIPRTSPFPIQDPAPLTIFTTGGSKDINDVSQWRHKSGSVPDKDNILQAVATALPLPSGGGTAIYFAASRFDNSGDAQLGFWFFQQSVAPQNNGTFGPGAGQVANHVDGDLLLLVNFEGGGLVPTIQAYKWQGGVNGGPVLVSGGLITGECGVGPNAGNFDACAITNPAASNAPASWNYVPKSGAPGVFPPQAFFEGGVKLSAIFGANAPCFSSFLAETRSSSSITATLKDFAEGSFNLCKISVTKDCRFDGPTADGTQLKYHFSGNVTNSGAGTVYDVEVVDTPLNVTGTPTPPITVSVAPSIAPGASAAWSADFVTTALTFTDQAVAQAASAPGGAKTVTDTTTAGCQGQVNSSIQITKTCVPGTTLVDIGNNVVVQVGVSGTVTNNGNTRLTGITLANNPATTVNLTKSTLDPAESTTWSATYQPAALPSDGTFNFADTIRVTAATPAIGDALPHAAGCTDADALACAGATCPLCPSTP